MQRMRESLGLRLVIIAVMSLILLIPAQMIRSLIRERQERRNEAMKEISQKWGESQTITGPILTIPSKKYSKVNYIHYLPEKLTISGSINPEIRYRGLYEVVLYNAQLQIEGKFSHPEIENLNISPESVLWDDAFVAIGISDMKGIKDLIKIKWNQEDYDANPGIVTSDVLLSGISAKVTLDSIEGEYEFSTTLNFNGSSNLLFTPVGKTTQVDITSNWPNPSFTGNYLPETRDISPDGFRAKWKILYLNRNYPQQWIGSQYKPTASSFGINLYLPVDEYQKTMRTVKYAIMFISLTFLSFFLIELLNKKTLHPIQYLLIGFGLLVFYTLLLSISEHIPFKYAYLIASLGIILLIAAYTKGVLKSNLHAGIIGGILLLLYGFLYIILQLEEFALLMGSIGLFIILAVLMYITRNIDWFSIMVPEKNDELGN
ncbi:MAG: cell envelope integrity protein CreD [Calditrichaeota bacterium]|nr:MAG: cell envelope integrity protein CreD [Calditrichota bacterium]